MSYNLLDEAWIPVLYRNGLNSRIGILKALSDAGQIRQVSASNPMDRFAIVRFLLALLCCIRGKSPAIIDLGYDKALPAGWAENLQSNRGLFNLLGDEHRFYQCRLDKVKEKLSTNYLAQEVPTGTNSWHFRHSTDGANGLCPACCALGLLRLPIFATSGGRGKPPGVNSKPPIYAMPVGSSLEETLILLLGEISEAELGTPAWEKPNLQLPKTGKIPILTGLTWLPRRIWLDDPDPIEARCISCGSRARLIRQCIFAGIGSTKTDGGDKPRLWSDPHAIYDGEEVMKPSNALGSSDAAAGQWARILAGILKKQQPSTRLWIISFATVQNDKYLEAMEYEFALPFEQDDQEIQKHIELVEAWQMASSSLARRLKPKNSPRKHTENLPLIAAIRPHVESKVSAKASEFLSGEDEAWEHAANEYSQLMTVIAKSLAPGSTTASVRRRKQIADVRPYFQSSSKATRKPVLKPGVSK